MDPVGLGLFDDFSTSFSLTYPLTHLKNSDSTWKMMFGEHY